MVGFRPTTVRRPASVSAVVRRWSLLDAPGVVRASLRHRAWRYRLRVDRDGIRWMRSWLRPGDAVVDVGAYKGGYTYWMRSSVGSTGSVLAFEPQPRLASYLRRCASAFSWSNVRVEEVALSSGAGRRELRVPGSEPSPAASLVGASLPAGSGGYLVPVDTLDRRVADVAATGPVRLVKCDVEGHEMDVFEGARGMLTADRPPLLFECEARHDPTRTVEDVFEFLHGLGYRGFFFWHGRKLGAERFRTREHQVQGRRPYCNNFIFVPEEGRDVREPTAPDSASAPAGR
jgi:FkbM family methyltransferase